jgi:uncharacterized cupin superfamily protein
MFLGVRMKILLSAKETGGQFSLIEGVMPPGSEGGLQLHANEDESMHLLEGELEVIIGDKKFPLTSGPLAKFKLEDGITSRRMTSSRWDR